MSDNFPATPAVSGARLVASDQVAYSGDSAADLQLLRLVFGTTGAEGSKTVVELDATHGLFVEPIATERHLGAVGGNSVVVGGSFTRPADTNAYVPGDLIANSVTPGSVVPIPIAAARVNAGTGVIRRIRVSTSNTGLTGTEVVRVRLFKTSPTVTVGDNGVLTNSSGASAVNGVTAVSLGPTDVALNEVYNDGAKGFTATDIVFDAAAGSQNIYALIETRSGFTPVSGATWTVALEVLQD